MVKILTFSSLYPNAEMPQHGLFVEQRLRRLVAAGGVGATVVAPVPWFPARHRMFGKYARFARVPQHEERNGLDVWHPRYPMLPKVGMSIQPLALAQATLGTVRAIGRAPGFSVIDAHYVYPDGVAAAILAQRTRRPLVITARGSDINVIGNLPWPRRMILWAVRQSAVVITVSEALRRRLLELGAPADKVRTLRNGVDLDFFSPADCEAARRAIGCERFTLLSVGRLVAGKGHELVIRALALMPDAGLIIVGEGPLCGQLETVARECGVTDRVRFTGALAPPMVREHYRAADVLILASQSEGMPNVVLEALACGTPVIATDVGGVSEILVNGVSGTLLTERTPQAICSAVAALRANHVDSMSLRKHVEAFSWDATVGALGDLFRGLAAQGT